MSKESPAMPGPPVGDADILAYAERRAIWDEAHRLAKARREEMARVMAEYDKTVHWQFTHTGPLGDPWFSCHSCGASECRLEPPSADTATSRTTC